MKHNNDDLLSELEKLETGLINMVETFNTRLEQLSAEAFEFVRGLQFDEKAHHHDLSIYEKLKVKTSGVSSSYRFAVLKPHVESANNRTVSFRAIENDQWVAFGVCHSKIIESKQFQFIHSNIGHGAYMVSSNGGVWSHTNAVHNNAVKAFTFSKG